MEIQIIIPFLVVITSAITAFILQRKRRLIGAHSLTFFSLFLLIWSASFLLYNLHLVIFPKITLVAITYFCSTLIASGQLTFSIAYSKRYHWLTRPVMGFFLVQPLLTQILLWVTSFRNIFFFNLGSGGLALSSQADLWSQINSIYILIFEIASVLLLLDTFVGKPRVIFEKSGIILIGSFIPIIFHFITLVNLGPHLSFDPLIIVYSMVIIMFSYGLFRDRSAEVVPISRDIAIEGMQDGWMVIDTMNNIVDINPAIEKLIGLSRDKIYGRHVDQILVDWPNITKASEGIKELDMRRSIRAKNIWRYLNIKISHLVNRHDKQIGHLIVWRDITERKMAEDSRQRARDEMFVLLNTISNTSSNAMNVDEFLSETIYQIISPFRSQAVLFFLLDQNRKNENDQRMIMSSHYGLPQDFINRMKDAPVSSGIFDLIFINKQPILIDDIQGDLRLPLLMNKLNFSSMLVAPLAIDEGDDKKILGCLFIARNEGNLYNQEEMVRLTVISDQIAGLIYNDRRRQVNIALSERQRLLRDLHDSVSQKLYGLVTLTEAAQAAEEAGLPIEPSIVLEKIGENARQAVKEMRLFLYEMQPMDLKKEGLVSVLHHRLAAVEGRANVKARLLTDENISLPKDVEVAYYYIAQEALNNILRHAQAKSILVTLKQSRQNIVLEILDDGQGFDPQKVDRGGMGLGNMKERALQVNGKFKITSKLGEGTKISVKVAKQRI